MLETNQILQNRYQLQKLLGRNAGRQTWLAIDLETQETVVLKLLAFGEEVQWEDLKLFEREAQVLQQLSHPRIPKYRDYFSIDDRHLWFGLVQEYIPGESLRELLDRGKKFTPAEIVALAKQILQILTYLHELSPPVLHRDIKPSNLILGGDRQEPQIYLVDFGAVQDKASAEGKTFTVVGTYGYAPMEQFGGRAVAASDLYGLGATLIHLLVGISPAELPQDDVRIEFKHLTSASDLFMRWVEKMTEPSVKKRFSSAREAIAAFESGDILKSAGGRQKLGTEDRKAVSQAVAEWNAGVKLEKSWDNLKITIPSRWATLEPSKWRRLPSMKQLIILGNLISCGIVLLPLIFGPVLFPFLSIIIVLFLASLRYLFNSYGCIYIEFNHDYFEIKNVLFNIRAPLKTKVDRTRHSGNIRYNNRE
jgi:serine/threonine protein kinase